MYEDQLNFFFHKSKNKKKTETKKEKPFIEGEYEDIEDNDDRKI